MTDVADDAGNHTAWPRALAAFGLLGAMAVAALGLRNVVGAAMWHARVGSPIVLNPYHYAATAAIAASVVAALLGWWRVAAAAAVVSCAAAIAALVEYASSYEINPAFSLWPVVLTGAVAVALLASRNTKRRPVDTIVLLSWSAACLIGVASAAYDVIAADVHHFGDYYAWSAALAWVDWTSRGIAVATAAVALFRLGLRVAARVGVLATPVVTVVVIVHATRFVDGVYPVEPITVGQWVLLACVPLLVLGLGAAALSLIDWAAARFGASRTTA